MSSEAPTTPYLSGRYGMTIPIDRVPLSDQREWIVELEDLGYTDVWSSEANTTDAFSPLALASAWAPSLRLGTAIVPAYTRGPALLAQSVASLADAAPGRFAFGIGSSSNVIVEGWNGMEFTDPYRQVRDMVRFVQAALTGEKVSGRFGRSEVKGFRLGFIPAEAPTILVAALREGMLGLAGREADGAILNWLSAEDVAMVAPVVARAGAESARPGPREVVARVFVAPTTDRDTVMAMGRYAIAAYLSVPVYAAFHEWLGRGEELEEMWRLWGEGDRQGALAAIPEEVVDDLIIWGTPEQCREHVQRYVDNGVTTPVLALLPVASNIEHHRQLIRDLAPR
ncbi:MAG: LLM class F420-dependent oxidoreductase [Microthrixaceae bacterium]